MGVPAFFRWLSKTYGTIVVHCVEEKAKEVDGVKVPLDTTKPNPNDVEFDNLYLDMNGIIHPCCHPEDKAAPGSEDEMMEAIFAYIDRLFSIVRPRRLLYMAIDGVAPRAKMNQQRSRRFRASKESMEKKQDVERITKEVKERGGFLLSKKKEAFHFDSNCITPGTEFMFRLADCLRFYITDRLMNDPGWKNIKVILSDANTPGEGEHKIMDYIRRQRANPDHDPNTHHCLCGADADLIMLGLATHEPNFTIIREEFKPNQSRPCDLCGQTDHELKDCMGLSAPPEQVVNAEVGQEVQFIFVRLNILREHLERELTLTGLPFKFDFERAVDDWVLMCFFVGNDFLPHLPSLEIREGAIGRLVNLYKKAVYKTGGYLTKDGIVNLERVQLIMTDLGEMEDEIFKKRREKELYFRKKDKWMKQKKQRLSGGGRGGGAMGFVKAGTLQEPTTVKDVRNYSSAADIKAAIHEANANDMRGTKRPLEEEDEDEKRDSQDTVRLWEDGWRDRYYQTKFGVSPGDAPFRKKVAHAYVQGLCWVLRYYYQGCASWKWYFPYHYAPFASDFIDIHEVNSEFETDTKPFKPLEQLMSVFPAASGKFLPPTWRDHMSNIDSPIIDFYPEDFKIDLNGKKYAWQGVALLPFVDEPRLLSTLAEVYPDLTDQEKKRNSNGPDRIFVSKDNPLFEFIKELYDSGTLDQPEPSVQINPELTKGVRGTIGFDEFVTPVGGVKEAPIDGMEPLKDVQVLSATFKDPQFPVGHLFSCAVLPGAKFPPKVVKHQQDNKRPGTGGQYGQQRYRPQLGFTPNSGYRGNFSGASASRMIKNSIPMRSHGAVPPPSSLMGAGGGYGVQPPYRGRQQQYAGQGGGGYDRYNQGSRQSHSGYGGGGSYGGYGGQSQGYGGSRNQGGYGGQGGYDRQGGYGNQRGGYGQQSNYNQRSGGYNQGGYQNNSRSYPRPPQHGQRRY